VSYLTVVDGEVKMMQGVVCRTVNDVFQWVAGYHIRVVDLCSRIVISGGSDRRACPTYKYAPEVDKDKETEV